MAEYAVPTPRSVNLRPLIALAGVLAVVLTALAVLTWVEVARSGNSATQDTATERAAALGVANQVVVDYTSLDYRSLTQDFQDVANLGDANFKNQFLTQTNPAAELIVKAKATSQGTVDASAVQNLSRDACPSDAGSVPLCANVLVSASQAIKNTSFPKGQVVYFRFDVALVHQQGKWLVDAVNKV